MSDHQNREPSAQFRYAAGAGLGLLIGAAVGLFLDRDVFLPAALIGMAIGLVVAYVAQFTKP
ncbi:MAG: hypothetical protein JWP31_1179 [Aeromicrobium sp.]|nr:hypothetical protein [Aeromicrobium sp.]